QAEHRPQHPLRPDRPLRALVSPPLLGGSSPPPPAYPVYQGAMLIPKALTIAVPSAPEAFRGRVWEVMSRGRGPQRGLPPPDGIDTDGGSCAQTVPNSGAFLITPARGRLH